MAFAGTDNRYAIDKARRELGYVPRVDLDDGVRATAHWYMAAGDERAAQPVRALHSEGAVV